MPQVLSKAILFHDEFQSARSSIPYAAYKIEKRQVLAPIIIARKIYLENFWESLFLVEGHSVCHILSSARLNEGLRSYQGLDLSTLNDRLSSIVNKWNKPRFDKKGSSN